MVATKRSPPDHDLLVFSESAWNGEILLFSPSLVSRFCLSIGTACRILHSGENTLAMLVNQSMGNSRSEEPGSYIMSKKMGSIGNGFTRLTFSNHLHFQ